jgi:hypothetical protein
MPEVFLLHVAGDDVSRAIEAVKHVTVILKITVISKIIFVNDVI